MIDRDPVLFKKTFGSLRPLTPAAEALMATLPDKPVRVEIKGVRGNTRRLALYWICVQVACEQLSDAVDGVMTPRLLHRYLKRRCGLSSPIVSKKTGEIIEWNDESLAFENMPENERAAYIDHALGLLSTWIGCDITQLRSEGEARFGARAA